VITKLCSGGEAGQPKISKKINVFLTYKKIVDKNGGFWLSPLENDYGPFAQNPAFSEKKSIFQEASSSYENTTTA